MHKHAAMHGFTNASQDEPIHAVFERQVRLTPHAIAVCDNNQALSYLELNSLANQAAHALIESGVKTGDVVGLCMGRSVKLIVGLLAILKAGGAYLPLEPSLPTTRRDFIFNDAKINTILSDSEYESSSAQSAQPVNIDEASIFPTDNPDLNTAPNSKDLVYVLYTSGSTGQPKGVEIYHRGLTNVIGYRVKHLLSETERAVIPVTASLAFDASAGQIFTPICSGGKLIIVDNLLAIGQSNHFNEITCIGSTPSVIRAFILNDSLPPALKVLFLGGENVEQDLCELIWKKTNILKLINLYGPTEATVHSTYAVLFNRPSTAIDHNAPRIKLPITIGKPIANTEVFILDDKKLLCTNEITGEIAIAGDGLARGYRHRATLTHEKFNTIEINGAQIPVYLTGDLGIKLADGNIKFAGRCDRQVKIRGHRIELDEIESTLSNHNMIKQCAVEVSTFESNQYIVAYLALNKTSSNEKESISEIKNNLSHQLPHYMVPHHFMVLDSLPLTSNDKLDRNALPSITSDIGNVKNYIAPKNDLQNILANTWQTTLNIKKIGIHDSFIDLGGDSLLAVQVSAKLKNDYQLDISIGDIFQHKTIASLSQHIEAGTHHFVRPHAILLSQNQAKAQLFCCSGINIYQALADCLASSFTTYGLYTPTEDSLLNTMQLHDTNLPTIEKIAQEYANIITAQYPQGPYYLLGISFGGVIAFETAKILAKQGKVVPHLFLVDPVLTKAVRKLPIKWGLIKLREAFLSPKTLLLQLKHRIFNAKSVLNRSKSTTVHFDAESLDQIRRQRFRTIVMKYEENMQPYSGNVTLFRANNREKRPGYKIANDCGWSGYINGKLNIYNFEGDHLDGLKQPAVQQLANTIMKILD